MSGSYNYYLVVLSVLVAILSSYTALELAERIKILTHQDAPKAAERTLQIRRRLNQAVSENELSMYFQPGFSCTKCATVEAEALIRWHHPTMGDEHPMEFIPVAEQTGRMMRIGN